MNTYQSRTHVGAFARFLLALGCAVPSIAGSSDASQQAQEPREFTAAGVSESLAEWRTNHGGSWQAVIDRETGFAQFLHGGRADAPFAPTADDDYFVLARQALEATRPLHGVDADTLEENQVMFLPLGNAGTTDKMTVQFRQRVRGVPVVRGFVNALFDMQGRLLSIDVTGLPHLSNHPTTPTVAANVAAAEAHARFTQEIALPITRESTPELVIDQFREAGTRRPRLAWQVEVFAELPNAEAEGFAYFVDAHSGEILRREARVHQCDVSGTVRSMATPGTGPDVVGNPATNQPMPNLHVVYNTVNNVTTDANGNFNVPGAFFPLFVTVLYRGPYCNTVNLDPGGSDYSLSQNLTMASGNVINMNPGANWPTTAEANAFLWVNKLRNWTKANNPFDLTADFQAQANVNISLNCNAFYNGVSVNFYGAGSGCENTAYSSIVLHEMGHWLNDRYFSFNGPDGFGEGNADVFAMYVLDHNLIGEHVEGPGNHWRDGNNTRQFCGDFNSACYGAPHDDGEVLMGALWKVRARLKASLGTAAGGAVANSLFSAWMLGYNDVEIKTIIEAHWLTLDDNDGNLSNGTPRLAEIDGGFRDQGFPGSIVYVEFSDLTPPWNGASFAPFYYVAHALPFVAPGGTVMIQAGSGTESPWTINQNVTLRSMGGTAILK